MVDILVWQGLQNVVPVVYQPFVNMGQVKQKKSPLDFREGSFFVNSLTGKDNIHPNVYYNKALIASNNSCLAKGVPFILLNPLASTKYLSRMILIN